MSQDALAAAREAYRKDCSRRLSMGRPIVVPAVGQVEISVLIVHFGDPGLTYAALESVAAQDMDGLEAIVIDHGPGDGLSAVRDLTHGVTFLGDGANPGFLAGANHAASAARGRHLAFLNNDARLGPGALASALARFAASPDAGVVGGRLLRPDGKVAEAGCRVWRDAGTSPIGHGLDAEDPSVMAPARVDYVSGAFLVTPRALFAELGGFDPAFAPAYCEDVDYCLRAAARGLATYCETAAHVVHLGGGGAPLAERLTLIARNRQVLVARHGPALAGRPERPRARR